MERFWSKVDKSGSCWIWMGLIDENGYGRFMTRDASGKRHRSLAHRVSFALLTGIDPAGRVLRHSCDTPLCVNPHHLLLGTQADNMADMVRRGRQARGTAHGHARLDAAAVAAIRKLAADDLSHREIAERFLVSRPLVSMIVARKRWAHA